MRDQFKKIEIIAYQTVDGVCRVEYKGYVIQTYGYDDGNPDLNITHFIIDPDGHDVCEKSCLIECINFINREVRK